MIVTQTKYMFDMDKAEIEVRPSHNGEGVIASIKVGDAQLLFSDSQEVLDAWREMESLYNKMVDMEQALLGEKQVAAC